MTDLNFPDDEHRLQISSDDLLTPDVDVRVSQLRGAGAPQTVRAVGAPSGSTLSSNRPWYRLGFVTLGAAGLVGGIVGAILAELIANPDSESHWFGSSEKIGTIVFTAAFAVGLGVILVGWTGIESRSWNKFGRDILKASPFLLVGAIAGGWLAQVSYEPLIENVFRDALESSSNIEQFENAVKNGIHFPRGVAFALVGGSIGLAFGASKRALRPAINGLVGGLIGGFIGGFTFDFVGDAVESGFASRIVAFAITGVLIGVAVGLIEEATKQHWIEIVSGGMAGKQFILFQKSTTVGASPSCGITLIKDPAIAPEHVVLTSTGTALEATSVDIQFPIQVNGMETSRAKLGDGDLLTLGSTIVRYRSKADAMPQIAPSLK